MCKHQYGATFTCTLCGHEPGHIGPRYKARAAKHDIIESIIATNTPVRVKTNRKYIKIDVKTANLILAYCSTLGQCRSHHRREPCRCNEHATRNFLGEGWTYIIEAARIYGQSRTKVS